MGKNSISDEEVNMFFLSAYVALNLTGKTRLKTAKAQEYFNFRYEYWKDDLRVEFMREEIIGGSPGLGLPVTHCLTFDEFDNWVFKKSMRRE